MLARVLLALLAAALFGSPALGAEKSCALILEHAESAPFTSLLRAGLERAGRDFGLKTSVIVAPEDTDQTEAFEKAAAENGLVIVATDNMHEILRDNAANFRRVKFGVVDAGIRAPNISCVTFADEQAAFLAGAAAAMLAAREGADTLGWLSGMDTPAMRSLFSGFCAGAEHVNPKIRVIQAIAGSFTSPADAAAKAAQLAGARVVALAAGAGNGAAARALAGSDAFVISLDSWQPDLLPGKTMAGIAKALDRAVYQLCRDYARDDFKGKEIDVYNLANGGVALEGLESFAGAKYPDIARRARELAGELAADNIHLRSMRQRTLCDCLD